MNTQVIEDGSGSPMDLVVAVVERRRTPEDLAGLIDELCAGAPHRAEADVREDLAAWGRALSSRGGQLARRQAPERFADIDARLHALLGRLDEAAATIDRQLDRFDGKPRSVLRWLVDHGDVVGQGELIGSLGIERTYASKVLALLERAQLVQRHPDPEHRSRNIVSITTMGRLALGEAALPLPEVAPGHPTPPLATPGGPGPIPDDGRDAAPRRARSLLHLHNRRLAARTLERPHGHPARNLDHVG